MSAGFARKVVLVLSAVALSAGCTSSSSSTSGARWPWTKASPKTAEDAKHRNADVLGAPPAPKSAKNDANKPYLLGRNDSAPSVTLRSPRIIDDREIDRASR